MGEILVRATIWLAVAGWAVGAGWWWFGRGAWPGGESLAFGLWSAGLILFLAHVILAYGVFYGWSQAVAYEETARQTHEVTGWRSGMGLWWNYAFGLVWLGDFLVWWRLRRDVRPVASWRSGWGHRIAHGFMAFMVLNGTVVFGQGAVRWYGEPFSVAWLWPGS